MRRLLRSVVLLFTCFILYHIIGRMASSSTTSFQLITLLGVGIFSTLMLVAFLYYIIFNK